MIKTEPQKQHRWLQKLVGDWTIEMEVSPAPGEPPEKFTGTETVRSLDGIWFLAEGRSPMPGGGEGTTLMTLGYDPQKGRFVGTWIGSMMSYLWVYDGELDAGGRKLSLHSEGPDMTEEGKIVPYKDVIEFLGDDHRTLTSHGLNEKGEWSPFMEVHYRRT